MDKRPTNFLRFYTVLEKLAKLLWGKESEGSRRSVKIINTAAGNKKLPTNSSQTDPLTPRIGSMTGISLSLPSLTAQSTSSDLVSLTALLPCVTYGVLPISPGLGELWDGELNQSSVRGGEDTKGSSTSSPGPCSPCCVRRPQSPGASRCRRAGPCGSCAGSAGTSNS